MSKKQNTRIYSRTETNMIGRCDGLLRHARRVFRLSPPPPVENRRVRKKRKQDKIKESPLSGLSELFDLCHSDDRESFEEEVLIEI